MDLPAGARTILEDGSSCRRGTVAGDGRRSIPRILGRLLAVALAATFLSGDAVTAFAQKGDVPTPRISPLKETAAAGAPPADGDALPSSTGDLAGDPLVPPEDIPDPAAGAALGGLDGLPPAEGDIDGGFDAPLSLAPQSDQPLDLMRPTEGPIDLGAPPPTDETAGDPAALGTLILEARLTEGGPTITSGMTWRVFGGTADSDGKMRLVGEANGGAVTLKLKLGSYFVHAAYGRSSVTKRVKVGGDAATDSVILNAGGLRLAAFVGKDQPLPAADISFDIYAPDEGGSDERMLLVSGAPPNQIVGLSAGIYHVVCRYGDANAVVRADIRVEAGKLTDAAVYQKAARLTLKLVEAHGGEALANTSWSVVTPSGENVADSVGAFPSVVLAVGDYTAIAKHDSKIYERNFTVEPGVNRDVEVLLK